jgi:hypothetical protein
MAGEGLEHVVEESDPAAYPRLTTAVESEADVELSFFGRSVDLCGSRHNESVNGEP